VGDAVAGLLLDEGEDVRGDGGVDVVGAGEGYLVEEGVAAGGLSGGWRVWRGMGIGRWEAVFFVVGHGCVGGWVVINLPCFWLRCSWEWVLPSLVTISATSVPEWLPDPNLRLRDERQVHCLSVSGEILLRVQTLRSAEHSLVTDNSHSPKATPIDADRAEFLGSSLPMGADPLG